MKKRKYDTKEWHRISFLRRNLMDSKQKIRLAMLIEPLIKGEGITFTQACRRVLSPFIYKDFKAMTEEQRKLILDTYKK